MDDQTTNPMPDPAAPSAPVDAPQEGGMEPTPPASEPASPTGEATPETPGAETPAPAGTEDHGDGTTGTV